MKLNAPKQITWWIALVVGVVGVIGNLVAIPVVSTIAFWLVVIALALLLLATAVKDL
jgi:uncharacterized membrane protein